jgi:hypothetical protein
MRGMDERRASPALFAVAILAALLLLYVSGYFGLSNPGTVTGFYGPVLVVKQARFFPNEVWATIYRPAAAVESVVRHEEVLSTHQTQ